MERTTIVLPAELREKIKRIAAERHQSMGEFIRRLLERETQDYQPEPRSIGSGASSFRDTSEKAGEIEYEPDPWR